jgi:cytochrome c553
MKKALKWTGIGLGAILTLIVLVVAGLYLNAELRLNKTYNVSVEAVSIPADPAAIERGRHWAAVYCADCHGDNMAGTVKFDDPAIGHIEALNLTTGSGGAGAEYTDTDWVRALRHGLNPEAKPMLGMPSGDYYNLSDTDLGDIIAYIKSVPAVDAEMQDPELTPMGRVLLAAGAFGDIIEAEKINHSAVRPTPVSPAVSEAYGEYLSKTSGCKTCHGADLSGGKDPDPSAPPAPNLTPGGEFKGWAEAEFMLAARTRTSKFMPWKSLGQMTDDELKALWLYLKSMPAKPNKQRWAVEA